MQKATDSCAEESGGKQKAFPRDLGLLIKMKERVDGSEAGHGEEGTWNNERKPAPWGESERIRRQRGHS